MWHDKASAHMTFDEPIKAMYNYLSNHTSEAIIMRLKNEGPIAMDNFQTVIEDLYFNKHDDVWFSSSSSSSSSRGGGGGGGIAMEDLTLRDIRSHIVVLWDSGPKTSQYGYDYGKVNTRTFWTFDHVEEVVEVFQERVRNATTWSGWYENPTSAVWGDHLPEETAQIVNPQVRGGGRRKRRRRKRRTGKEEEGKEKEDKDEEELLIDRIVAL